MIYPTPLTSIAPPTKASLTKILFSSLALPMGWDPSVGQEDDGCPHRQPGGTHWVGKPSPPPFVCLFMTDIKDFPAKISSYFNGAWLGVAQGVRIE